MAELPIHPHFSPCNGYIREGLIEMLTLMIFLVLLVLIMINVPIAVAMALTAIGFFVGLGNGSLLTMLPQRMYASTTGFTLLAIPFFILAGNLMNTGGVTSRIFRFAKAVVGHVPGGLGQVCVIANVIFSGMSGSAIADAAGLGQILHKAMVDNGFKPKFSAAIVASAATIGPVIPPSIPFVLYGALTGVSVSKLFLAGFIPGILMAIAMMAAIGFLAKKYNLPKAERADLERSRSKHQSSVFAPAHACDHHWRHLNGMVYADRSRGRCFPVRVVSGVLVQRLDAEEIFRRSSGYRSNRRSACSSLLPQPAFLAGSPSIRRSRIRSSSP